MGEQAKRLTDDMQAVMNDPKLKEGAERFTKEMEMMQADPKFQEQAKLFAEQMFGMKADKADADSQEEQAKRIAEMLEEAMGGSSSKTPTARGTEENINYM